MAGRITVIQAGSIKQRRRVNVYADMKSVFSIFKNNYKIFLLLAVMIVLPVYIIQEFIIEPRFPEGAAATDSKMLWYMLSTWLLSLFVYVYRIAAIRTVFISLENAEGDSPDISGLMDFAIRFWPKFIATSLIYALSVALGFIIILPGIIFFVSYTYYQYISVRTGLWGKRALLVSSLYMRKSIACAAVIAFGTVAVRYAFSYGIAYMEHFIKNLTVYHSISALIYTLFEFLFCIIDIYVCRYIYNTKIDFDISAISGSKSSGNEKY